jgi:predicted PurR-regulated permease PerM
MKPNHFNERFKQIMIFAAIICIGYVLVSELTTFIPGFLGAITLYMLSRSTYLRLINDYNWKRGTAAALLLSGYLLLFLLLIWISIELIYPKIIAITHQQEKIIQGLQAIVTKLEQWSGFSLVTPANAKMLAGNITAFIPELLNSTALLLTNLLMLFFVYYYLLVNGRNMERYLGKLIPLRPENLQLLAIETKQMIRANALGIPLICLVQGLVAAIGYWIFGVEDWVLWGFFTGLFAFFPLIGTMIVWVPLVAYLYATDSNWMATGLGLYSLLITGNVDYLTRITLMKRIGDVHPLVTVLGVIVGLNLFGFIGLVFGPLLVTYFLVLTKIYLNEFVLLSRENNEDLG